MVSFNSLKHESVNDFNLLILRVSQFHDFRETGFITHWNHCQFHDFIVSPYGWMNFERHPPKGPRPRRKPRALESQGQSKKWS